ncbi:MAG TPA: bile acid:sodium symporter family protein [Pseudonocardiaceae bacterium]|jgi:sodium/bile acid cotransporter 7|nr:bile acid:sodium symporter family protein [Pseudonocardiaceae bacterium]
MPDVRIRARWRIDPYIATLLATAAVASLLPARGVVATGFHYLTTTAIGFLFFLYGARLSTMQAIEGLKHWQLHAAVIASTFLLFPLLGLVAKVLVPGVLTPELYRGLMYLCCLPSTVQSSIAFTSIARGNVAAAVYSASLSNLIGIALTPLLAGLLLLSDRSGGGVSLNSMRGIMLQLLVPFVAGHMLRRWIGGFVAKYRHALGYVDRGSILLVVYAAFSGGVVAGIWARSSPVSLVVMLVVNIVLLAIVMVTTTVAARSLGFCRADEIAIVFCGSKKSLASGVPMAMVLFPASTVGLTVLPLMLFHQIQLMVCAWRARRYATRHVVSQGAEATIRCPPSRPAAG